MPETAMRAGRPRSRDLSPRLGFWVFWPGGKPGLPRAASRHLGFRFTQSLTTCERSELRPEQSAEVVQHFDVGRTALEFFAGERLRILQVIIENLQVRGR